MGLIFWWMLILWVLAFAGYGGWRYIMWKRSLKRPLPKTKQTAIAHSHRLTGLPAYKAAMKEYRKMLHISATLLSVAVILSVVLTARPARISLITPVQQGREIMLCLDVSGSLLRTDTSIVNRFGTLVKDFTNQRVGLTVFNSSSVMVLPPTDDYKLITAQLQKVGTALQLQKGQGFTDLTSGTLADFDKGTSLVSDGIVSCVNNLGQNPQKRSQSVILATDNEANGTPLITSQQAMGLATKRGVRVYAIDPGQSDQSRAADHTALQAMTEKTGGSYYQLSDKNAINSIVSNISKQEEKFTAGVQTVAVVDSPSLFIWLLALTSLGGLVLIWRLRL